MYRTRSDTFRQNSTKLVDEIMAPINEAEVPFSSTYGVCSYYWFIMLGFPDLRLWIQNHDNQVNITHLEELERELKVAPMSYTRLAPPGVGGEEGPGNYWVPVCQP